jgi:hypothetical protein
MANIHRATDLQAADLREYTGLQDLTEVTVWDDEHPTDADEWFVSLTLTRANGEEVTRDLSDPDLSAFIHETAQSFGETVKFCIALPAIEARDFEEIAEAQGWTEATCYGVLMDFIDNHADKARLCRYAEERAAEENAG